MSQYRVMYRFKEDDGEWSQWREKSPDINGWYENGHWRTVNMDEAKELVERFHRRWGKYSDEWQYEIEIVEAIENEHP